MNDPSKLSHPRQPATAALLSLLLPGLGQLYVGNLIRALAFACASLIAGVLLGWLLLQARTLAPAMTTLLVLGLGVSLASAVDAFLLAKRSGDYRLTPINRPAVYALFTILALGADLGGAIGISLVIKDRFVEAFVIPTEAMMPTIHPGDRILAFKNVYLDDDPKRDDLVIFKAPGNRRRHYIKRVVGLPGETVSIQDGKLLINGIESPPIGYEVSGMDAAEDLPEITVPDHHCFVLGDNRALSKDSRQFGPLGYGSITARVESRFWPLDRTANLRIKIPEN